MYSCRSVTCFQISLKVVLVSCFSLPGSLHLPGSFTPQQFASSAERSASYLPQLQLLTLCFCVIVFQHRRQQRFPGRLLFMRHDSSSEQRWHRDWCVFSSQCRLTRLHFVCSQTWCVWNHYTTLLMWLGGRNKRSGLTKKKSLVLLCSPASHQSVSVCKVWTSCFVDVLPWHREASLPEPWQPGLRKARRGEEVNALFAPNQFFWEGKKFCINI